MVCKPVSPCHIGILNKGIAILHTMHSFHPRGCVYMDEGEYPTNFYSYQISMQVDCVELLFCSH